MIYTAVVVVISAGKAAYEHCTGRRIGSDFVKMDVHGWIMAGGVSQRHRPGGAPRRFPPHSWLVAAEAGEQVSWCHQTG